MNKLNKDKKSESFSCIIIILVCLLIMLPLLIISIYNRPSADDYDYGFLVHNAIENKAGIIGILSSAIKTDINFYNNWQGLYTSAFLLSLQPGVFGPQYYMLTPFIVIAIMFITTYISFSLLNSVYTHFSKLKVLTYTTIAITIISTLMPFAVEGLYWYNGAMNYIPFVFLDLLNTSLIVYISKLQGKTKSKCLILLSILLSFIISGGNHVTTLANILLLIFLSMWLLKKKRIYPILSLMSAIVGFIIMYIAPGTSIRKATFESATAETSIIGTMVDTLFYVIGKLDELMSLVWFISIIIITPLAIKFIKANEDNISKRFPIVPLLCSALIICGMLCVPYYAMNSFGEGRLKNVVWIMFIFLSWYDYICLLSFLFANKLISIKEPSKNSKTNLRKLTFVLICLLAIIILPHNEKVSNSLLASDELISGTAKSYCEEMDKRFELYENPNLKEVKVKPIESESQLLFFSDITTDPNIWPNTSISRYYNKKISLIE